MHLDEFNALGRGDASETVAVWAAIPWWVEALVAARPYDSVETLADRAQLLAKDWNGDDLEAALARHPRIGEKPRGEGAEARASRGEQAAMAEAADDVAARIAAGNAAYEDRFGRVFLIRAAGRTPDDILSELDRRLSNDDETEAVEALGQLAEIALLRLRSTVSEPATERMPS